MTGKVASTISRDKGFKTDDEGRGDKAGLGRAKADCRC